MNDRAAPSDRRLDRRIPLGTEAFILLDFDDRIAAECIELSVGGMTLRADYVPGQSEILRVEIVSPTERLERPPLVARIEVRRCHMLEDGRYEIGGAIIEVLE